tara:strand:+ start:363 stop:761 length:399 start_codon:yes stop_codon:yes gene_type:complete
MSTALMKQPEPPDGTPSSLSIVESTNSSTKEGPVPVYFSGMLLPDHAGQELTLKIDCSFGTVSFRTEKTSVVLTTVTGSHSLDYTVSASVLSLRSSLLTLYRQLQSCGNNVLLVQSDLSIETPKRLTESPYA